jgi:adenine-specific DNA-methyltransferase
MPLLHWLNKDTATKAAAKSTYRLLEEVPELSYGDPESENLLIQGDNLEALKALLPFYAGKVKCICIDPPYNTKSAFEHYDDNLEHSQWLSLIYPRLELLRELLSEDGSIWITIDDNESHYLKVILDEVFGRKNCIANVVWQKVYSIKGSAKHLSDMHDHIHVYGKNIDELHFNLIPRSEKNNKLYKNPDNDPNGPWRSGPLAARNFYSLGTYSITCPSGRIIDGPPKGSYWRVSESKFKELDAQGKIYWGKGGNNVPAPKIYLSKVSDGIKPPTLWKYEDVGHNQDAKREVLALFEDGEVFTTPKPEKLIQRIIQISSNENDLVLDSFLGSGTTTAVAHKMNRRYIGIEIGEHAQTHCQPRHMKVADGEQGGISKSVNWKGGGGFRFCKLGPTVFDEFGLLNSEIKFPTLAAHVWYIETRLPLGKKKRSPLIGTHNGTAYYLLYNGILGDKRPDGGNVLTRKVLEQLPDFDGPKVIYGETSRLGEARLREHNITFKQIPYDVKAL